MAKIKAVIFDFIGTLTCLVGYSLEKAEEKMFKSLVENGFEIDQESFFQAYKKAHRKHREIRYEQLIEVTNAIWVSDALTYLGYDITPEDERIKTAINIFFKDYLDAMQLRPTAKQTLEKLSQYYKLGLVSNYTYAPVIYAGLRKLEINHFFNTIIVSEATGWRKPNPKIFQEALKRLRVKADETLFVGDTPAEDILGAKSAGMMTAFIPSQFNSLAEMEKAPCQPDFVIEKLNDSFELLDVH
ncbi:MAG: HAD family hydrolase [Candidatus Bathyarchaeia archaeon]